MTTPTVLPRRSVIVMVVALVGLVGVVAMHGVSSHASLTQDHPQHTAHDQHEHEHDGVCTDCGHDASSSCALVVAHEPLEVPAPCGSLRSRDEHPAAPMLRVWSPDPPVPKSAFAMH
jgi:hypothetical protein